MAPVWHDKRILIAVKTYPVPAWKGIEVSCTAGVTDDGKWIRLFPVPYRYLEGDKQFQKYEWITARVAKATDDKRPESYHIDPNSIQIDEAISRRNEWSERRKLFKPLIRPSMCAIQRERDERGCPTLGLFKPAAIKRLIVEPVAADWTQDEQAKLSQTLLFQTAPPQRLQKIPFEFRYEFDCSDPDCAGHKMMCTDWEMLESCRRWRQQYSDRWQQKFKQRYEDEMINRCDTHFYVGTVHRHPDAWIIVGLFYPPRAVMNDLFG